MHTSAFLPQYPVMLLDLGDLRVRNWRKEDLDCLLRYANNAKIAGNLREMFKGIAALGADVDHRGALHTGSVLIDDLTIAGE